VTTVLSSWRFARGSWRPSGSASASHRWRLARRSFSSAALALCRAAQLVWWWSKPRLYALYLCAIVLGLRRGELLGLTWEAVDLDEGRLWVRQTLAWVEGRPRVQQPKTRASRRVIPLPDVVVTALREHRKRQDDERADAGDRWTDSGFVFTTKLGGPMSPYALTKYWHAVRAKAGVPTLRFHDLRHTAVSLLLALGVPPHVVREIAGHSDIKVTMMVYAHGRLDEKAAALTQLGTAVAGALPSTVAVTEVDNDQSCP
jgi:integrase